jgi:hypothetical protein
MNLNDLALEVTHAEGKKVQVNIGQIKEILRIILRILALMSPSEVESILKRFRPL